METFEEKYKNNNSLLNSLNAEDWVELLKEITIEFIPFIKDEEIEAINKTKNIIIEYYDLGLRKINICTKSFMYEDISIELNIDSIIISRQQGHSKFEKLYELPIIVIRKILKSKIM